MRVIEKREDLFEVFEHEKVNILNRTGEVPTGKKDILVCAGTGCLSSNSGEIIENLNKVIKERDLDDVEVHATGCCGFCEKEPIVKVMPDDTFYAKVTPADAEKLVESHIINGEVYARRLFKNPQTKIKHELSTDIPFYKKQVRIALSNCGLIDAEKIEEYIGAGGYLAVDKVLNTMSPNEVVDVIKESGLRGRGGGGFPTGIKWGDAASSKSDVKYVICNADEGDPGAFMDRSILEGDPHSIIEAMIINAYAIGSNQGYVYVRTEYPVAVMRLEKAIVQAKMAGLIGENILGTGFNFELEIKLAAGAFICGEETALIASIEGERGMPRNKPPFPTVRGLWGKPTNVNNVETYANIPKIIMKGAAWYASYGTEKSKGTKVFSLGGKVNNTGLIEVPMGTTLREVIYEIGGGIIKNRKFKALQTGGSSGGCLLESQLDTLIDYEDMVAEGSMMGSGGMIVMDEDTCMVDVARFYLDFSVDESCGKCAPCREGTHRLLEILNRICDGKGEMKDIETLEQVSGMVRDSSLCGLGQTAPNPIVSTLKYFRHEYEAHVNGKCPAGVCSELTKLEITDTCNGCGKCAKNCPVDCIQGGRKEQHSINQDLCIACGACKKACPVEAIINV